MTAAGGRTAPSRTVFGHPRGMQPVLVLFMVDQLRRPGHVEHIVGFRAIRSALFAVGRGFGGRFYGATPSASAASVA